MREEKRYICEFCSKIFYKKANCLEHEKNCKINVPIKRITFYYDEYNKNFHIEICNYPNTICKDDKYELINESNYPLYENDLMFDKIHNIDAQKFIYTKNLSKKHEKDLINILIKNEITSIEDKIKNLNIKYNLLNNNKSLKIEHVINKTYYYK